MNEEIFKVNGYNLDPQQKEIVLSNNKNILVIAGAGSGKSLTIVGKIKYLIEIKGLKENEILCLSFTNDSCNSLKKNLINNGYNIDVNTFHKLALKILKDNNVDFLISNADLLEYIINEFFDYAIFFDDFYLKILLKYLKINTYKKNYKNLKKYYKNEMNALKLNILTFINLYKSKGYNDVFINEIFIREKKLFKTFFNKKNLYFLLFVIKIMHDYKKELLSTNSKDFDDLILEATKVLINSNKNIAYKYVIIDEFQDTSLLRYNLIKELLKKSNANFMAVGDDYQSIYRFSGCDLFLFLNFNKYFNDSKVYKIEKTYRNSYELIKTAEKFIKKNKIQIDKILKSDKLLDYPIKILYYENEKKEFFKLLDYLYDKNLFNILIVSRNNNDIYSILNKDFVIDENGYIKYNKYPKLNIRFLTVHKSKGLEEEVVIVISLKDDVWGFPNKKTYLKIFNYVLSNEEKILYAEERRLFYVALTRTKSYCFLLTSKKDPSIFVKEIVCDSSKYIENIIL